MRTSFTSILHQLQAIVDKVQLTTLLPWNLVLMRQKLFKIWVQQTIMWSVYEPQVGITFILHRSFPRMFEAWAQLVKGTWSKKFFLVVTLTLSLRKQNASRLVFGEITLEFLLGRLVCPGLNNGFRGHSLLIGWKLHFHIDSMRELSPSLLISSLYMVSPTGSQYFMTLLSVGIKLTYSSPGLFGGCFFSIFHVMWCFPSRPWYSS